ncbi:hypothetical protein CPB83DRAFT_875555 [Crepidotus variabilis]|uniref:Uncharacterized protein n=1 Tax=Crepidotus variabilis TaxID=179855 RepID=A0A9P6JRC6_9AGAR|nr:hypothetical protein CPB83DRAFT_875555 [Crepidotus variabilis]
MFSYIRLDSVAFLAFFLQSLLLLSSSANALPILARQVNGQPKSVTTVHTTMTPSGPVTETCVLVFNPVKDAQGKDAVEEVKTCTVTSGDVGSSSSSQASSSSSSSTSASTATPSSSSSSAAAVTTSAASTSSVVSTAATSAVTSVVSSAQTSAASPTSSAAGTTAAPATSTPVAATSTGNGDITVIGTRSVSSSVAAPSAAVTSSSSAAAAATTTSSGPSASSAPVPVVVNGMSTVPGSPVTTAVPDNVPTPSAAAASGTAAAAETTPTQAAALALPGKTLSVLPIGLGVFAGISVIALIVVGLVTYERTKFRKARCYKFRQQRLAEQASAIGYGGAAV